jgi:LysM repeat protein
MALSFTYTVKSGDTLTAIAKRYGFSSWKDLYNHPLNALFRAKRPNPDKIYPNDKLEIPVSFKVQTTMLRLAPGDAFFATRKESGEKVLRHIKSQPPQFQWIASVEISPPGGEFEVGFIQNLLASRTEYIYKSGPQDVRPKRVIFSTPQMPILDNREKDNRIWFKDRLVMLDATGIIGGISADDNPGGFGLLIHEKDSSKLLTECNERLDYITWLAARVTTLPRTDVRGYELLKHVRWSIDRVTSVNVMSSRAQIVRNVITPLTPASAIDGRGTIANTPVLDGMKAYQLRTRQDIG